MSSKLANTPYTQFCKLFNQKHELLNGAIQAEFKFWLPKEKIRAAVVCLRQVEHVPTIYNKEEPEKIRSFYFPCCVFRKRDGAKNFLKVNKYADFGVSEAIILEGTVGQGKSILLRYLHNCELNECSSFPLFIELKDVKDFESIQEYIVDYINNELGLTCSDELFDALVRVGFFSFYFDGFDEVKHEIRQKYVSFIAILNKICPHSKVFVTSRPENEIQRAIGFAIFSLKPFDQEEQLQFVKKQLQREAQQEKKQYLLTNISKLAPELRTLLNTPLILTLFHMVYRNKVKIPESHSDFYKKLFETLVSEHDGLKLGYSRPTKSGYTADEIKASLEHISWSAIKTSKLTGTRDDFLQLTRDAMKAINKKDFERAPKVLEDIQKNTCLIQVDDHKYKFLHESIPNYFAAACFVTNADDDEAKTFYTNRTKDMKWKKFEQLLRFLSDIDKTRFSKYFFMPLTDRFFEKSKLPEQLVFTKNGTIEFCKNIQYLKITGAKSISESTTKDMKIFLLREINNYVIASCFSNHLPFEGTVSIDNFLREVTDEFDEEDQTTLDLMVEKGESADSPIGGNLKFIRLSEIVERFRLLEFACRALNRLDLSPLHDKYRAAHDHVKNREAVKDEKVFGF